MPGLPVPDAGAELLDISILRDRST